jgi:hypothetical protein
MFTGSGMPMRFADIDGSVIDCYQVTTQMPDESGETFPRFCDQLLDKAIGPEGYYGVFCANMHMDNANSDGSDAIIASAQARNIPVISAKQMLTWLDGRNSSSFKSITWNTNQLSFSIDTGTGSYNLQAMIPVTSSVGQLTRITRNGTPVNYNTQIIKGVTYAFFAGNKGNYVAHYGVDNTAPVITNIVATPHADGTATITWNTNGPANSRVDYNAHPNALTLSISDINLVTNHNITLSDLLPGVTYHYRVTSADGAANSATVPTPPDSLTFIMPVIPCNLNAVASVQSDIACNGGTTTVRVTATGGTLPYTGTGNFTAGSGTHDYIVTDKNGCSSTATIILQDPPAISVVASPGIIACAGGTTSVVVTATGGTGALTGTGTFVNVKAGTYTYTVTDEKGCTGSTTITISNPAPIIVTATPGVIACNGGTTSVTVKATGGTGPYRGTGTFNNINAGTSTFTVTDANGCSVSATITISQPGPIIITATPGVIACNGGSTSVTVTATGGTAPYTGTGTFANIKAGTSTFTVRDARGCISSKTISINQPSAINVTATVVSPIVCNGGSTSVLVTASGGTPPYTGTGTIANVTAGTKTFTVTDARGCMASRTINVANGTGVAPAKPGAISGPTFNICGSGTFTYSISPVSGATRYIWSVPAGLNIVRNDGTTSIVLSNASSAFKTNGTLSVAANSSCGTSTAQTLSLFAVAPNPGFINGPIIVRGGQTKVSYSVTARSGIKFNWSVPPGATITSGQGTNSIMVNFANASGSVRVFLSNACSQTSTASLPVIVFSGFFTKDFKNAVAAPESDVKVYPNPANSIVTVTFNSKQESKYEIVVTDLIGKPIIKTSGISLTGRNEIKLDMSKYALGMYLITLAAEESTRTIKLYKEK